MRGSTFNSGPRMVIETLMAVLEKHGQTKVIAFYDKGFGNY